MSEILSGSSSLTFNSESFSDRSFSVSSIRGVTFQLCIISR